MLFGAFWEIIEALELFCPALGALLGAALGALGGSWALLGASRADLEATQTTCNKKSDFKTEQGAPVES